MMAPLDIEGLKMRISEQLPLGCTLREVESHNGRVSFHAEGATYFFAGAAV